MKRRIRSNWSFIRFLQLGAGLVITIQSLLVKDWALVIAGLFFTAFPVFNVSCCGTRSCYPAGEKLSEPEKDISYEEVV